jgi:hypothetical protein
MTRWRCHDIIAAFNQWRAHVVQRIFFLISLACCSFAAAQSYRPDFDPGAMKGPASGPPNEVMVLGTPHLRYLKFDPAIVNGLLDRLAAWRPQAIATEDLSGVQCDFLRRYPQRYKETVAGYCWDPAPARTATGLDVAAATAGWEQQLTAWPAAPTAAQRRHLAALFLAGGERGSALVQWLRLPAAERRPGDGLDTTLADYLHKLATRTDEGTLISAALAVRLGHERLYPMDDHSADSSDGDDAKAAGEAITKAWDNPATAQRKKADDAVAAQLRTPDDLLAMYRHHNAPGLGKLIFASDFGAAMNEPSPRHYGRNYLGYWETRNLRMASNIRDVVGLKPGTRMLVVVGASHKAYLEAYLHQMHDVRLVDTSLALH